MAIIDDNGYISRKIQTGTPNGCKATYRNWWLVKYAHSKANYGSVNLKVILPKRLMGKRVRFKIEEVR